MHPVIAKTFGGLSIQYYFRQFVFGLILAALFVFMFIEGGLVSQIGIGVIALSIVNTFLYPYSRFVYESIIGFIMGDNVFFGNVLLILFVKFITMLMCWYFAILIAPLGLVYLYYYHSRNSEE